MIFIFMFVMLCMTERCVFMNQNFKELHRMITVKDLKYSDTP